MNEPKIQSPSEEGMDLVEGEVTKLTTPLTNATIVSSSIEHSWLVD
jgi:hypothetical protein